VIKRSIIPVEITDLFERVVTRKMRQSESRWQGGATQPTALLHLFICAQLSVELKIQTLILSVVLSSLLAPVDTV
jgi:hypothetical protein